MPIPDSQCDTWRNQGATATAKVTHESVRTALSAATSAVRDKDFEVYLQGLYRNDTNIYGDSDVDIVVQLNQTVLDDWSGLVPAEQALFAQTFSPAVYTVDLFDADVLKTLTAYFGPSAVTPKNKCIDIAKGSGRLAADVVVALRYRRWLRYRGPFDQECAEGISFWGRTDSRQVVNYPKMHYQNGVAKNLATNGTYKPSVRMIKNARKYLVSQGRLDAAMAPSYFVECGLYNLPNECFTAGSADTFYRILKWLDDNPDWTQGVTQSQQTLLFGSSPEQWQTGAARWFHSSLVELWNDWGV